MGSILAQYDSDQKIPLYGFGCKLNCLKIKGGSYSYGYRYPEDPN